MTKHKVLKTKWVKHNVDIFRRKYPQLNEDELYDYLYEYFDKHVKNPTGEVYNNYMNRSIDVSLLELIDWLENTKPICSGYGCFFKRQDEADNPVAQMLLNFLNIRKTYKDQLKLYKEGTYDYMTVDRKQLTEKINANSYYGASGADTSNFFNIFTASSVTMTGRSLISTTGLAFEAFIANNVKFIDLDDCMYFINFTLNEKKELKSNFLTDINKDEMIEYLKSCFYSYNEAYTPFLESFIFRLTQDQINRIYYKNNLYEFSNVPKIKGMLNRIFEKTESFKNPNRIPEEIKDDMEILYKYYKEFVVSLIFPYKRIDRMKRDTRKAVVIVDTDSNIINLKHWFDFCKEEIIDVNDKINHKEDSEIMFMVLNTVAFLMTRMVTDLLERYTKKANIPKAYRPRINMKNEYLFTRLMTVSKKKRYVGAIRLREGSEIYPEKTELKGLDFMKSSTREETKDFFKKLLNKEILHTKKISVPTILKELQKFELAILESIKNGERHFLSPVSVKELGAYADPYKISGVKGVLAWNIAEPDYPIQLPVKLDLVKVKLKTLDELEKMESVNKEVYERLKKDIFENPEERIAKLGIGVMALPRNIEKIPDWLMPFVDYDTIVNDNVSKFHPILKALGLETIRTSKKEYFSNILNI